MMQQISIYLTSIILGIMLFFSFVVAPVTFTALDEENARKFIRKIFPYYYTVNLAISSFSFNFIYNSKNFFLRFLFNFEYCGIICCIKFCTNATDK